MAKRKSHILLQTQKRESEITLINCLGQLNRLNLNLQVLEPGSEVMAFLEENKVHVLITDATAQLPELRKRFPALPVIAMVSSAKPLDPEALLEKGATDFILTDQIEPLELERSIRLCMKFRRVRRAYLRQRESFARLFRNSLDAILLVDEKGNIDHLNPAFTQHFGWSPEELEGHNWRELLGAKSQELAKLTILDDSRLHVEVDIRKADQEMARCKMAVTRLGAGQGFQVILHDITSYLEALERGKRAQRLGMTGRIARGLAHEIRNPLSNISMATHQLAQEGLAPRSDSIYLDIINRNNLRIAQLIDAILDSSKDTSFSPVRVEIHSLIEEALLLCKDRITLQEVEVVEDYADHAPILRLDPDRIRLALVNLMLNAIEAMRKVETPRLVIRTRAHPTEFMIQVEDNGEGIPPELQEKIFEPFFTSKKTGIGLGMLSLQNAIQMHGGRLQLKSTVGEGTSFSLFFPVPPPSKPES